MNRIFQSSLPLEAAAVGAAPRQRGATVSFLSICVLLFSAFSVWADDDVPFGGKFESEGREGKRGVCSSTARAAFRACRHEVRDDFWIAVGNCLNSPGVDGCIETASEQKSESFDLCRDQRTARLNLCARLGERAYDPEWSPGDFVDPLDIGTYVHPNPYFPLIPGTTWRYESEFLDEEGDLVTETISVEVRRETKLIEGVTCIVVNDVVEEDGVIIEDTDDWYAQDLDSNVWYCGEIALNFESFEGDVPEDPELVDIEGSWKGFRDGAKPGIIMQGTPTVGQVYRQEIALGNAEDAAEVISTSGSASVPFVSCVKSCVVTREFTAIEPDVNDNKYYAPGIGPILEVNLQTGDRVELIEMHVP